MGEIKVVVSEDAFVMSKRGEDDKMGRKGEAIGKTGKKKLKEEILAFPLENMFDRIARDAITKAEAVDCSMEEFLQGLEHIEISIRERRQAG